MPLSVAGGIAVPSGAAASPRTRPKATASARLVNSTLSGFCTGRIAATRSQQKSTSPRLESTDGWCDDPGHADYNRPVALPHDASCETLWRDDSLYDLIVVTSHNSTPVVPGAGSAIFVHVAGSPDYPPTEGCIAFARDDLEQILREWVPGEDRLVITGK